MATPQHEHLSPCIAFAAHRRIAAGELCHVALEVHRALHDGEQAPVLIFDDVTGAQIEVDLRGTPQEVLDRLEPLPEGPPLDDTTPAPPRGPGRPKLGVVAREVTLLPRHWAWLQTQRGGASVALRKLVEEARQTHEARDRRREAQEVAYRFLSALAGNLPDFEEVTRALFASHAARFAELVQPWPRDVRDHALRLATRVFQAA
jgi:hypothetical protein